MIINISNEKQVKSNYDSETKILHTEYSGLFNAEIALNHFHLVEEFAKTNLLKGAISDLRKLTGSYNKVIEYLDKEGFPNIKKTGLVSEAFVISNDLMINHLTDKLVIILKNKQINVGVFKSQKEAKLWMLKSFKK